MKTAVAFLAFFVALLPHIASADTFGVGTANEFTMDFVNITGGAVADDTNYGAVSYGYRMGVHEASEVMIASYNSLSGGPTITIDTRGSNRPATSVSWNEAARFVNWLNTSRGHPPAYKFLTTGGSDGITLWAVGDDGYDPDNRFRNSNAFYFLPSEDEWYRAAYFSPSESTYFDYATGSDSAPIPVFGGTAAGTAVYGGLSGYANVTDAGGLSPFGTMAQNGNVWEWAEDDFHPLPGFKVSPLCEQHHTTARARAPRRRPAREPPAAHGSGPRAAPAA